MVLTPEKNTYYWKPSATISNLKKRAEILKKIRIFFEERNILEVETQLLSHATGSDPYVHSIATQNHLYLQTSPEYAMKRLLASGSGSIYQICKAFRNDDTGRFHNPEFTMLEWYRLGFDHHALMDEMDCLLQIILNTGKADRLTYQQLFKKYCDIDPFSADMHDLKKAAARYNITFSGELSCDGWLDLLMTHIIEPKIGQEKPFFLYDFSISQAALAKIRWQENPPVASRFEVYFKGVELANGFHELQDANEQRKRFTNELQSRKEMNLPVFPIDENFLAALDEGLPDCAGVALGVDRLIMLALDCNSISEVLSFNFERA